MSASRCPPDDELAAFAHNTLGQHQMEVVAGHVVRCAECEQKIGLVADPPPTQAETLVPVQPGKTVALGGTLLDDRYVLHERLGAGGMGFVYRAEQVKPVRRPVAVKVMRPGMDSDEFLGRFEAERQALAVMNHDNIAKVFEAGTTTDGRPYLAMELVDGSSVTRWCDTAKLSTRERVALFVPVCRAIQHAHLKGVIHRDLKPSNILVAEVDGKPVPKVIDFGIAKATGRGAGGYTQAGVVIGTPEYMSPEQAGLTGADVDTRSDVYALGVVLYELLAGTTPFPRAGSGDGSVWDLLRKIREEDPPAPASKLNDPQEAGRLAEARRCSTERLRRELRGELQWVVRKALERERERRYQSAHALADDLERYLRDEPLDAGPPTALYRARKFIARNRGGVLAAAAVLVALLAAVVGTTAGLVRSLRAEGETRDALLAEGEARRDAERSADQARREKEAAERATAAAEAARKDAERAQGEAVRAQQRTRAALFAVTDFVTGGPFGRAAQVTAAEQQFLADILALLQRFGADDPGAAADVRAESLFRVGLIQLRLGQEAAAVKTLRAAQAVWEKVNADAPDEPAPRLGLVKVYAELGWVMVRNRDPAAAEVLDRAVTTADALAKDHPTAKHRSAAAKVRGVRADYFSLRGDKNRAVDELTAAAGVLEELAAAEPEDPVHAGELATALDKLAAIYDQAGDESKACALWGKSRTWFERLAKVRPHDLETAQSLARVLTALARRTKGADGTELYKRALAVRKGLMTDFPAVPQYRVEYANTAANLAARLADAGDVRGAEPLAADALAIRARLAGDNPNQPAGQIYLAHSLCVSGRTARLGGRAETAARLLDRAVEVIDPQFARDPRRPLCRDIHAMCHTERADQRHERGEFSQAAEDYAAAAESSAEPDEQLARRALARVKPGEKTATEGLDALRERSRKDGRTQFVLARVYATLAAADPAGGHADRAADCLRAAADDKSFDRPQWKWEPDLDPVRTHKGASEALARLKAVEVLPPPRLTK